MKRIKRFCILLAIVLGLFVGSLIFWLGVRYASRQRDISLAWPIIQEFGGDMGSIPCEPFGSEYRIEFCNRPFTREELERLKVIDPMTHRDWVGVMFKNCNLTTEDLDYVAQILPSARLIMLVDKDGQVISKSRPDSRW